MLKGNSQKVEGRRIAAFVRYRKNAQNQVAFRSRPRGDRGSGGRIEAASFVTKKFATPVSPLPETVGEVSTPQEQLPGTEQVPV